MLKLDGPALIWVKLRHLNSDIMDLASPIRPNNGLQFAFIITKSVPFIVMPIKMHFSPKRLLQLETDSP